MVSKAVGPHSVSTPARNMAHYLLLPPCPLTRRAISPILFFVLSFAAQAEFEIRCEWGAQGIAQLAPLSDVIIIVDVLSFSTCVDIAAAHGAQIYPFRFHDERAMEFARARNAELAGM